MIATEEICMLRESAILLHKTMLAYGVDSDNPKVVAARELVGSITRVYDDTKDESLSPIVINRCARCARDDFCYLLLNMYEVFNSVIGKRTDYE